MKNGAAMGRARPAVPRISRALLEMLEANALERIKVVDLCAWAQVSRTTFYAHYSNVDDVYRTLVRELVLSTSAIRPQLRCTSCAGGHAKRPLCEQVREGGAYHALLKEDRFMRTLLDVSIEEFNEAALAVFSGACESREVAFALFSFQIAGCIGAAKAVPATTDWTAAKRALDTFIRGGLSAVEGQRL